MACTPFPKTIDAGALAGLLGLTANRVNALARDGAIPKTGRGQFALPDSVRAYVAWARKNPSGRPPAGGAMNEERIRLTAAQADRAELQAARDRGELVPLEEVRREWAALAVDLRARLLAVGPRVATTLALDRAAAARLDEELRAALEDIADDR